MKRISISFLIISAMLLASCTGNEAETESGKVTDATVTEASNIPSETAENKTPDEATDVSSKRNYSERRTLSALESDGSVTEIQYAIGDAEDSMTLYTFDENGNESAVLTAEYNLKFCGDFIIIDHILYTAKLQELGRTHALYPENPEPRYDEEVTFGLTDSDYYIRFYLADKPTVKPIFPSMDDKTDYLAVHETSAGKYIGIFRENGSMKYRTLYDTLIRTSAGAYVREETSIASIAGNIAGYDLYFVPNAQFLSDKNGSVKLLTAEKIINQGGFIVTYPYDTLALCTVYNYDLKVVADHVNIARELDGGGLIVCQAEYTDESADDSAACLTLGHHRISVISKDGKLTKLTDCDKVFAMSDYGAVYLKDRVIWFTSVNGDTTWLSDMNPSYEYTGQVRIAEFGESPEHYYFTDAKYINENGAPMRYEWIYDPVSGYFQTNSYFAAELHENVHIIERTY